MGYWLQLRLQGAITGRIMIDEPCALCGRLHPAYGVVVVAGKEVCTYSDEWKAECEIRTVMRLPDKARKPKVTKLMYLEMIEKERGYPTRQAMREEMVKRYREKK